MSLDFYTKHIKETAYKMKSIKDELYPNYDSNHSSGMLIGLENWLDRVNELHPLNKHTWTEETLQKNVMSIMRKFVRLSNHMVTNKSFNPDHKDKVEQMKNLLNSFLVMEKISNR